MGNYSTTSFAKSSFSPSHAGSLKWINLEHRGATCPLWDYPLQVEWLPGTHSLKIKRGTRQVDQIVTSGLLTQAGQTVKKVASRQLTKAGQTAKKVTFGRLTQAGQNVTTGQTIEATVTRAGGVTFECSARFSYSRH